MGPPLIDCSVFLLSNTAWAPESAPAPSIGTSIGCSLCCLLSNSQMCLTKPHRATGGQWSLGLPFGCTSSPASSDILGLACSSHSQFLDCICLPDGRRRKKNGTMPSQPHLALPRGAQALQVDLRAIIGSTSKVKLDVRRRGLRWQEGPRKLRSWSQLLNRFSWRPCLDLEALKKHLPQDLPTPFCKS